MYDTILCDYNAGVPVKYKLSDKFMKYMKFTYDFVYLYHYIDPSNIN